MPDANQRLRLERRLRGWSQIYLARQINVPDYYISRWERGEVTPSLYYQQKLCDLFEKTATELGFLHSEEPVATPIKETLESEPVHSTVQSTSVIPQEELDRAQEDSTQSILSPPQPHPTDPAEAGNSFFPSRYYYLYPLLLIIIISTFILTSATSHNSSPLSAVSVTYAATRLNVARTAITHASSVESHWSLADVHDGIRSSTDASPGWSSDSQLTINHTEWLQFAFNAQQTIDEIDVYLCTKNGQVDPQGYSMPINFSIDVSNNAQNWTTVSATQNYPAPTTTVQTFKFAPQRTRYLRIVGTNLRRSSDDHNFYRMQFAEIEIY
jgi:transcriptional regulator with XRE-family HTH domain